MGSLEGPLFQERSDARTSFEEQLNVIPHQPHSVRLQNVCSGQARKPKGVFRAKSSPIRKGRQLEKDDAEVTLFGGGIERK
ncbi:hypothetical protein TNCV_539811 [Trichonephila clavipes]|uniref:Uncharacterized protein n=2 Tax=Trichonephila TaxID=2585208 RepID=A0A8X6GX07_TRICU|nr:hypothetical protein TNCT_174441 [Trichonephila clavata]GFT74482.1 hypothetical protein TNCV_539811 [Trichonephila clavipes]GFY56086.1 hypothetical protein TNIN_433921 [Trichonephila inaurata madagascariensis]